MKIAFYFVRFALQSNCQFNSANMFQRHFIQSKPAEWHVQEKPIYFLNLIDMKRSIR